MGYRPYRSLAAALTILALIPGMVLAHASAQERLTRLDESIAADPSNPELYLKRGHFWGEMKQWDEALADYDRAIELRADVGKVDFARGKLLLAAGHPALAEIILDGILNAKPDHPRVLHVRARARTALGRHSEAADDLLSAVNAMASPSPDVYLELARVLVDAGRGTEALVYRDLGRRRFGAPKIPEHKATAIPLTPPTAASEHASTLTRGPYLQLGTPTSMVVRWRTDTDTNSLVRYGTDVSNLIEIVEDLTLTTEHEVKIESLDPDTTYFYSVGTTEESLSGGDSAHHFTTSPPAGPAKPTRVWVLGDSGTANADARAVRDAYEDFTGDLDTDVWLMLGDNAYLSGTDAEYQAAVFDMYPNQLRTGVVWPTLGNHDGVTTDSNSQTGPYYDLFTLPTQGEAGGLPSGTEAYYAFDYGNIHFICLESFQTDRSPSGAMLTWLEDDLSATTADWVIAFWHHPPYTKGSHNSDIELEHIEMRQNALPILEDLGIDLVLGGHSHDYERSFLLDGHYGSSDTLEPSMILDDGDGRCCEGQGAYEKPTLGPAPHEGAVYVVAGSSGQAFPAPLDHPAMVISLDQLGSLVLDIDGNVLDATFLRSDGTIADTFQMKKGDGDQPPPPPPPPQPPPGTGKCPHGNLSVSADGTVCSAGAFFCGAESDCYNAARGADLAERIDSTEPLEPGDLVEIDPQVPGRYRRARGPNTGLAVGVVTAVPAITLASQPGAVEEDPRPLLALMGRVPVKATTENGPIRIGDLLVSSSTPGAVMRCVEADGCELALVGKALEELEQGGGTIEVLLMR